MKFNLLSDNKIFVHIAFLIGILLMSVDDLLLFLNIALGRFWLTSVLGGIVTLWCIFSYYYIYIVEKMKLNPSRMIGNISFLILSVLWGIFSFWIYLS